MFIGLTSAGAELAKLNNPLLHVEDFEAVSEQDLVTRFSEEEREWFWKHVNKHIVVEKESLRQVLAMTQNEEVHVKELTEQLVKYVKEVRDLKATGTPPARRAYTSSLVNRWTGLGYLCRPTLATIVQQN